MAYTKPLPVPSAESKPFWEGCHRHELLVQRCQKCHKHWFPPSALCPECLSTEWEWAKVSGKGKVFSFVVYHRLYHPGFKDEVPYTVALIELEEGPRMLSNVVGDVKAVKCDMPVEVFFEDATEEVSLPKFRAR